MRHQGYFLCAVLEHTRYLQQVEPANFTAVATLGVTRTCHSAALNVSTLFVPHPLMFPDSMWGEETDGGDPTLIPAGYSPDVVYFTWGMHALHMHPLRKFAFPLSSVLYEQALGDAIDGMGKVRRLLHGHPP